MSIKVALVGVGNCASSLIQGVTYYKSVDEKNPHTPGLMHNVLAGYKISDIKFVAGIDVDKRKVGTDLSKAIFSEPNNTKKFAHVPVLGVKVQKGPVLDGIAETTKDTFLVDPGQKPVDAAKVFQESRAEVVISYLPVGSEEATRYYMEAALKAKCAFINAIPVFVASTAKHADRFKKAGLPMIGDDIKSQVGATITHRILTRLFVERGVKIDNTYQLNVGGNTDFLNMKDPARLASKKISKTEAVQSQMPHPLEPDHIHIGPSDYVPWLKDNKLAFIRIEGRKFGDIPISIEMKLSVEDSPNSAGVMIDAVRCAKLGLERSIGGPLEGPSAYFMKHPPKQYTDAEARQMVEDFIAGK